MRLESHYIAEIEENFFAYVMVPKNDRTDAMKDAARMQMREALNDSFEHLNFWFITDTDLLDIVKEEVEYYIQNADPEVVYEEFPTIPEEYLSEQACILAVQKNLSCYYDIPNLTEAIEKAATEEVNKLFDEGCGVDEILTIAQANVPSSLNSQEER